MPPKASGYISTTEPVGFGSDSLPWVHQRIHALLPTLRKCLVAASILLTLPENTSLANALVKRRPAREEPKGVLNVVEARKEWHRAVLIKAGVFYVQLGDQWDSELSIVCQGVPSLPKMVNCDALLHMEDQVNLAHPDGGATAGKIKNVLFEPGPFLLPVTPEELRRAGSTFGNYVKLVLRPGRDRALEAWSANLGKNGRLRKALVPDFMKKRVPINGAYNLECGLMPSPSRCASASPAWRLSTLRNLCMGAGIIPPIGIARKDAELLRSVCKPLMSWRFVEHDKHDAQDAQTKGYSYAGYYKSVGGSGRQWEVKIEKAGREMQQSLPADLSSTYRRPPIHPNLASYGPLIVSEDLLLNGEQVL
ncbi:hypothetical protein Rhopal_002078-T1 [Rhodotorula paludigena]|uniref:Uncharacterized protein n=1 Tax=Rhodotorula paludigena TaxID=86838 RepID=A0AAV5GIU1_9BASI|nr:hypothetical protein Rhopal_002078-T1 [Rhodotorula paludigena]